MDLKEYLKTENLSVQEFAALTGVSTGAVLKWVRGDRFPRRDALKKISDVTNGLVTANDFTTQKI
jgi:transcriptional regulator with XRE-family HTH domain